MQQLTLESVSLVSTLKWKSVNDECLLCNNLIGHDCVKCNQTHDKMFIKCMSILNNNIQCKHAYHAHCLQQYHKNNSIKCPMCNVSWT